jgi:hypothetical protein
VMTMLTGVVLLLRASLGIFSHSLWSSGET